MEVLKNVFSGGDKKAKKAKRKSGSNLTNRSSVSGVDVPRVRSSSSSSCIQESEREGFVFVERLKEGNSTSDVRSSPSSSAAATHLAAANPAADTTAIASSSSDADAAVASRLGDLDLRRGVGVESDAMQRTSPSAAPPLPAAAAGATAARSDADNFLTLKNVKGGFCLDKKLEKKVKTRSTEADLEAEPWLRPKLDLDQFDYDFTLEKSVLRDYN